MKRSAVLALAVLLGCAGSAWAHGGKTHVMGTVTAVGEGRVVVHTRDGKTVPVAVTGETKFRNGEAPARAGDLKVGDRVIVDLAGKGENPTASEVRFSSQPRTGQP